MLRIASLSLLIAAIAILLKSKSQRSYNSVTSQSIHYFSRPHLQPTNNNYEMIEHPSAWKGKDILSKPEDNWTYTLTKEDIDELNSALEYLKSVNPSLDLELISKDVFLS